MRRAGAHHLVEHGEVVEQRLGGEVDEHHVGAGEDVLRIVAGGGERPERRRLELRERRVGRRLDVDRERPGDRFHGHGLAARVQAVHGVAAGVADQPLPAEPRSRTTPSEVEHRLDAVAPTVRGVRPVLGHGAREAEPRRVPGLAPRSTHGERGQLVEGRPGLDVERLAGGGDEREHPLGELAGDAFLDQLGVVVHAANGTERRAGESRAASIESLRARAPDRPRRSYSSPLRADDLWSSPGGRGRRAVFHRQPGAGWLGVMCSRRRALSGGRCWPARSSPARSNCRASSNRSATLRCRPAATRGR